MIFYPVENRQGKSLTIADLHAYNILTNWYKSFDRTVFTSEFPDLDAYVQRVARDERVADYIRTKQEPTTWFPAPIGAALMHRLFSEGTLDFLLLTHQTRESGGCETVEPPLPFQKRLLQP